MTAIETAHSIWSAITSGLERIYGNLVFAYDGAAVVVQYSVYSVLIGATILLVASLLFCFKRYNPTYLRTFPAYAGVNLVASLLPEFAPALLNWVVPTFGVIEQVYFSYLFYQFLTGRRIRRRIVIVNGVALLSVGIAALRQRAAVVIDYAIIVECVLMIPLSLAWFRSVFRHPVYDNLSEQPAYWFVTGMLFYFCVLLATMIFFDYMNHHGFRELAQEFYSANNYAQLITYTLFIIGMTCRRKQPL